MVLSFHLNTHGGSTELRTILSAMILEIFSYSAVYALIAPKPLMLQMGIKDALWLGGGPAQPSDWFSGTTRGAYSDETIGAFLQLRDLEKI